MLGALTRDHRLTLLAAALVFTPALAADDTARQLTLPGGDRIQASLDENRNEITVEHTSGSSTTVSSYTLGPEVLDGLCLSEESGRAQLFVYDGRGYLAQWQLSTIGESPLPVRHIPGVVEVADCHIDRVGGDLYVLEESVGVWRYGAASGSDYERELLLRHQPHGPLDPEAESFSLRDGDLLVGEVSVPTAIETPPQLRTLPVVKPLLETRPVVHTGDAADDPAIWYNPGNPGQSRILAADKRFGLRVYDLQGKEVISIPAGRLNNVDLRPLGQPAPYAAIAAASNRTTDSISLFGIAADGSVTWLQQDIDTGLDDPYGLCMYHNGETAFVFINDKDGRVQQWRLNLAGMKVKASRVREFTLADQPEGCAADDQHAILFFGIEDAGLYALSLREPNSEPTLVMAVDEKRLFADVEGMDLYLVDSGGYLVVSSQGNDSFGLFDRQAPHQWRGSFRVGQNTQEAIDGVSDTDGLAVHSGNFGPGLEQGILVLQDGYNTLPREAQNFKLVNWQAVREALSLD